MANWIKMRVNLWDDPRVGAMVDATDTCEAAVIGGLYWLWTAADQHSTDGFMPAMTLRQLDRRSGIAGFGQALVDVDWLVVLEDGLQIARFEEHNGASAKRRASESRRKMSARNADKVRTKSGHGAHLEKEREKEEEEAKAKTLVHPAAPAARREGGEMPEDMNLDTPAPKAPDQVPKRITGDKAKQTTVRFAEFWAAYPVKKGRAEAMKKWKAKGCDAIADDIIAHVRRMEAEDDQWKRGFIPHGSTYVNGELWNDEPYREKDAAAVTAPPPKAMGAKAALVQSETPLEAAVGYIRQQYSLGAYGEGEHALAEMQRMIAEATEKYRGSKNGEA